MVIRRFQPVSLHEIEVRFHEDDLAANGCGWCVYPNGSVDRTGYTLAYALLRVREGKWIELPDPDATADPAEDIPVTAAEIAW